MYFFLEFFNCKTFYYYVCVLVIFGPSYYILYKLDFVVFLNYVLFILKVYNLTKNTEIQLVLYHKTWRFFYFNIKKTVSMKNKTKLNTNNKMLK
jgi:hypothetical protein